MFFPKDIINCTLSYRLNTPIKNVVFILVDTLKMKINDKRIAAISCIYDKNHLNEKICNNNKNYKFYVS